MVDRMGVLCYDETAETSMGFLFRPGNPQPHTCERTRLAITSGRKPVDRLSNGLVMAGLLRT